MLKRFKPDPIPEIHPEPEYLVEGPKKRLYEDTKQVLQVPWMGVITMALAHYQEFYQTLWAATGPIMASAEAIGVCRTLRHEIERDVCAFNPPKRQETLRDMGYGPREIENIKQSIDVFSHGNFPYAMIATLSRLALEADVFPDRSDANIFSKRHAPDVEVPFVLMEPHHGDEPTRAVYADIRETLGLPFINTDYRALARWPTYFALVWHDLRPVVKTTDYDALVDKVHSRFVEEALNLPNPTGITARDIQQAADHSASVSEILTVNQLFHYLLPGLMTNIAFFKAQLT